MERINSELDEILSLIDNSATEPSAAEGNPEQHASIEAKTASD